MQDRYADQFQGDSLIVTDGETQFQGMNNRTHPENLQAGFAQLLQNIRLDTLTATCRKGLSKQTNAIGLQSSPLTIPFTVGASAFINGSDGIFAATTFSDPNNSNATYIFMATTQAVYWMNNSKTVGTIQYPAGELVELNDPSTDMEQFGGSVYLFRGDLGAAFSVTGITSSGSTATVTTAAATGLVTGQYVRVAGAVQTPYNGDFAITTTGVSTFTYTIANSTTSPATGTITLNRLKLPLVWNGNFASSFTVGPYGVIAQNFSYMPTSSWGLLQQNRFVLELGRNAIAMSQINGPQAYDTINGQFNFNPGSADYLIGAEPYQDTQTLVFLRHSIWLVNGLNGDVASMTTQLLTATVGCVSRHTIATCGANVLFLSDKGVYMVQPGYELTLRGNSLPLSALIDPTIQQINFAATNKAFAAYFLNRYYLAVPLNGATRNNAVLVYNFINQQWESIDTFPAGFFVDYMEVALNSVGTPTLYFISFEGGIYAAEQNEMDDYAPAGSQAAQFVINAQIRTRRYIFGTAQLKKFNRCIGNFELDSNSSMTCQVFTYNPETTRQLPTITNALTTLNIPFVVGNSAFVNGYGTSSVFTRPMLINKRAYGLELLFTNTAGRGALNNLSIGAYVKDMKGTLTQ